MAQFIVYQNKNATGKKLFPFLLDVQSNFLSELKTCVVIPLTPIDSGVKRPITKLTPKLTIENKDYLVLTPQLAGIKTKDIGKPVADVAYAREEIIAAIDFLVSGL